jgi:Flp pilus assembly protein TadG
MARDQRLTDARRNDIFSVGAVLMSPFPTTTLRMCLVSIVSDANGRDVVAWSEPSNAPADCPAEGAVVDIPVSVLPAGQSVIMSSASYEYNSALKFILPQTLTSAAPTI